MSPELTNLVMFGTMIAGLLLGIPLAFVMGFIGVAMLYYVAGSSGLIIAVVNTFGTAWNITYITIPLFIFIGVILERAGIAEALFETVYRWSGPIRGGLAMGTVFICAIFAAMTGTASAATVTMGLIAVPAMLKRGYDKNLAVGTVAGAGTLGIIIPPSITAIIICAFASLSVGRLFMAGVFPGLLLALLFIAYIGILGLLRPQMAPAHGQKFTLREKLVTMKSLILPIFIIAAILGTIFLGIATPTESSAVGCVAVIIAAAINRKLSWQVIKETTYTTFKITALVMWLFFGVLVFTAAYFTSGGATFIAGLVEKMGVSGWMAATAILGLVFLMGCFMDNWAIIFIVAPVAFPIIKELGVDPYLFGTLFVMDSLTAMITPPFGWSLFYMRAVAPPNVSMGDIFRSVWPFVGAMLIGMIIVALFPQIALWLPNLMLKLRR